MFITPEEKSLCIKLAAVIDNLDKKYGNCWSLFIERLDIEDDPDYIKYRDILNKLDNIKGGKYNV